MTHFNYKITYAIIVAIIFIGAFYILHKQSYKELRSFEFSGVVEKVEYDTKGYPTVEINGEKFYLGGDWYFNYSIEEGDFLIKKKNELTIKEIDKNNGNEIIYESAFSE